MKTLLWLDDLRNPLDAQWQQWILFNRPVGLIFNIVWVKDYNEFVDWIASNGLPEIICFDHDLGWESEEIETKTGMDCAKWLVDYCLDNNLPLPSYAIQSSNPAGKANIDGLFQSFIKQKRGTV